MDQDFQQNKATDLYHLIMVDIQEYAFVLMDTEGIIVNWNAGATKIFGFSREEVLGRHFSCLFLREDVERGVPEQELARALETGRSVDERWHQRHGDGRFWASGFTLPQYGPEGKHTGFAKIAQDATNRKASEMERDALLARQQETLREVTEANRAAEEARRAAEAAALEAQTARNEAQAADRFKDEFIRQVSHELRGPLNGILLWTRLLRQGITGEEMLNRGLEVIERSADASQHLIDDLLEAARLRTGKVRLNLGGVNLCDLAVRVTNDMAPTLEKKAITLHCETADEAVLVPGDVQRLEQVVRALLSNAIKFTPQHGEITVAVRETQDVAEFQVRDTGIGFSPEFSTALFEPYRQEEREDGPQEGLGLGLFIAHGLVELHGGDISAQSLGKDRGAIFTIRLPLLRG